MMQGLRRGARDRFPVLLGFVYVREQPADAALANIERAVDRLIADVELKPTSLGVLVRGPDRDQRFAPQRLAVELRSGDVYAIRVKRNSEKRPTSQLSIYLQLRYNPSFEMHFQSAAQHEVIVPMGDETERRVRAAMIETFLVTAAGPSQPLHGGIAAFPRWSEALEEGSCSAPSGFGPDGRPVETRLAYDQDRKRDDFWTKARRAYWTTILGPDLAKAAGGEAAARATGAARVETRGECLVVQATEDPADFLAPDWPARSLAIRRWLWPHTIQNPFDAEGLGVDSAVAAATTVS